MICKIFSSISKLHCKFVPSNTWRRDIWQNLATWQETRTKQRQTYWLAFHQVIVIVWLLQVIFLCHCFFCLSVSWSTFWTSRRTAVQAHSPRSLSKWLCWIARWQKKECHWQVDNITRTSRTLTTHGSASLTARLTRTLGWAAEQIFCSSIFFRWPGN